MINRKQVVYKTELYKLYKRKDTWIFLTVILVPILYLVYPSVLPDGQE